MEGTHSTGGKRCPTPERPQLPANFFKFPVLARLRAVQQFLGSFEYRQSAQSSFNVHKFRPLSRIMETARMMIHSPQPIKCVEAVFLALYLTAGMPEVDRIPLSFKTQEGDQVHQHIVLLIRYGGKYGAFGISRKPHLMSKELEFQSISDIVGSYKKAYEAYLHTVAKIRVGLPVEHNIESFNYVCWRHLCISPSSMPWDECCEMLEKHVSQMKRLWEKWLIEGQGRLPQKNLAETRLQKFLSDAAKKIPYRLNSPPKLKDADTTTRTSRGEVKNVVIVDTPKAKIGKISCLTDGRDQVRSTKKCLLRSRGMRNSQSFSLSIKSTNNLKVVNSSNLKIDLKICGLELISQTGGPYVQSRMQKFMAS